MNSTTTEHYQMRTLQECCSIHRSVQLETFGQGFIKICSECVKEKEAKKQETTEPSVDAMVERKANIISQIGKARFDFSMGDYVYPPKLMGVIGRLLKMKPKQPIVKAFFTGSQGTGKTLTASLIAKAYGMAGGRVVFTTMESLKNKIHSEGFTQKFQAIQNCKNADVLIIDDIEHSKFNENIKNELKDIFTYRENNRNKSIEIITSNKTLQPYNIPIMHERYLIQFTAIDFGKVKYPYGGLTNTEKTILNLVKQNNGISYADITKGTGVSSTFQFKTMLLNNGCETRERVYPNGKKVMEFIYKGGENG